MDLQDRFNDDDRAKGHHHDHHHRHHFGGRDRHGHGGGRGGGPFGFGGAGGPPWGGGFPFPWNFMGRRGRVKRGDVRAGILALLSEEPRNGYQIMQELEQRSDGAWRPSPGSIYPALQQLEDEGLVTAEVSGTGRTFKLTKAGERYVAEHRDEMKTPWAVADVDDEGDIRRELFGMFKHIGAAAMQVAQTGTPEQIQEAKRILQGTRRSLYRLLAGDEPEDEG
jgi:DNA-binding PadR family transcriptional regulator